MLGASMFSGIVERTGNVRSKVDGAGACRLIVDLGSAANDLSLGASVAVNGVCLTVASMDGTAAAFDVVAETTRRSTLGRLVVDEPVNLERSLRAGAPIDGHFVQGHVDGVGTVIAIDVDDADYRLSIRPPPDLMPYMVPKGSVAVDGVSLTIAEVTEDTFTVALIPTTRAQTTLGRRGVNDAVNLESDLLVRAVARLLDREAPAREVDLGTLRRAGFL